MQLRTGAAESSLNFYSGVCLPLLGVPLVIQLTVNKGRLGCDGRSGALLANRPDGSGAASQSGNAGNSSKRVSSFRIWF